jgi:hypothetical protein
MKVGGGPCSTDDLCIEASLDRRAAEAPGLEDVMTGELRGDGVVD